MARRPGKPTVPWRTKVAEAVLGLPLSTGFRNLEGQVEFLRKAGKVRLTLTPRNPVPENVGPTLQHKRIIVWKHGDHKAMFERVLTHELDVVRKLMLERAWPTPDIYLRLCNSGALPDETFMERTCASCKFPYCTLVS